jgi:outer membrane lipoprotein carrier protein
VKRPRGGAGAALLLLAGAVRLAAQDPWTALDRAAAAYATLQTLSADFVQIVDNPLFGGPDTTRGRLYLEPPSRFAMRFSDPAGDRIVADGRFLWLYTPSTTPGQVIRTRIPAGGGLTPNLFGQFVDRPRERYRTRWIREERLAGGGTADVIGLEPLDPDAPFRSAAIWIDRASGLLARVEIIERTGQGRTVALRGVRTNAGVPVRELSFAPPGGVRVVDH